MRNLYSSSSKDFLRLFKIQFIAFLLIPFLSVSASTITSNGTGGGNWDAASTWNGGSVPLTTDNVIIADGDNVIVNVAVECVNLTVGAGVSGTLTSDNNIWSVVVTGDLVVEPGAVFNLHQINSTVNGNTTINGSLTDDDNAGMSLFKGSVTISATGNFTTANDSPLTFENGIHNLGTFSKTGVGTTTFNTNIQNIISDGSGSIIFNGSMAFNINTTLSGVSAINFGGDVTIDNPVAIINNTHSLVSGALDGLDATNSIWVNGANATFTYSNATIPMFTGVLDVSANNNHVIFNSTNPQVIPPLVYKKLTISGNSIKTLNNNTTVVDTLFMVNGQINANGNTLALGTDVVNAGILVYTSGSIMGNFMRWINSPSSYLFPLGTATEINSLQINITQLDNNGSLTASFNDSDPGSGGLPLTESFQIIDGQFTNGYWHLVATDGLVTTNYNVIALANDFTSYGVNSQTRLLKRDNGGNWELSGSHADASGVTIYRNGLSGISITSTDFGLGNVGCIAPIVTVQPSTNQACATTNTTFTLTATGATGYQWQTSIDGIAWSDITLAGANPDYANWTTNTLQINNLDAAVNGYYYRCLISNGCPTVTESDAVQLTVQQAPQITVQPVLPAVCSGEIDSCKVTATGDGLIYQWQISLDNTSWSDQSDDAIYTGTTTSTLQIANTTGLDGIYYRCVVSGTCSPNDTSNAAQLTVNSLPNITTHPSNTSTCEDNNATFSTTATGTLITYQWEESTDGGGLYNPLADGVFYSGVTTSDLTLLSVPFSYHTNRYRCVISGACNPILTTTPGILTVIEKPVVTTQPTDSNVCNGGSLAFITQASGDGLTYQWEISIDNGGTWGAVTNTVIYSGALTNILQIDGAVLSMNNYQYRCVVSGTCTPNDTTDIALLTISTPPVITGQPIDASVCENQIANFTVTATGTDLTYQWENSNNNGATWSSITDDAIFNGTNSNNLAITPLFAMDGYLFRCIVSGKCSPNDTSSAKLLEVFELPTINTQPINANVCSGDNHTFSIVASGANIAFQWQLSTNGGTSWADQTNTGKYSGTTTENITITGADITMTGYQYRCIVSGDCTPKDTSTIVTLTINTPPAITSQPTSITVCEGVNHTFSLTATGTGIAYQWQVSINGGLDWTSLIDNVTYGGVTTSDLTITAINAAMSSYLYRCIATGDCSPLAISDEVTLTVNLLPSISTHPTDRSICESSNTTFSVTADGTGISYQWQESTDGGGTWINQSDGGVFTGMTTHTMNITGALLTMHNNQYRCVVSGICTPSDTSNVGVLTITPSPQITVQPVDVVTCANELTTFTLTAIGPGLTYQWYRSSDGGGTWGLISNGGVFTGATTNSLTISNPLATWNGFLFRCVINGTCIPVATSNNALLTVKEKPQITIQPIISYACENGDASFSLTAKGSDLTYQWLLSTDGGFNFNPIVNDGIYSNVNSNVLNITNVPLSYNNYRYQCEVSGSCIPSVKSNPKFLIVYAKPNITVEPLNRTICTGVNTTFAVTAAGAGLAYQWQGSTDGGVNWGNLVNGVVYSTVTGATLNLTAVPFSFNNYRYRCVVSGTCSPNDTSTTALLTVYGLPTITLQPKDSAVCPTGNVSFWVNATGQALTYQWQISTNSGSTWANQADNVMYSGMTTNTMTITGAIAGMNNYRYRCVVSGACTPAAKSDQAILTLYAAPVVAASSGDKNPCEQTNTTFTVTATGNGLSYQWQTSYDAGVTWGDLQDTGAYSTSNTAILNLTNTNLYLNNHRIKCIVSGLCAPSATSPARKLTVRAAPQITLQPVDRSICPTNNTTFPITRSGDGTLVTLWQASPDGVTWSDITAAGSNPTYVNWTSNTLGVNGVVSGNDGYRYRATVSGACNPPAVSNIALMTVGTPPAITSQPASSTICEGSNTSFAILATGSVLTYQWKVNMGLGFVNVTNSVVYSGATTATLNLTAPPASYNGYQYQCVVSGSCPTNVTSNNVTLTVNTSPSISVQPTNATVCEGIGTAMDITAAGSSLTRQWQVSMDNGGTWNNITAAGANPDYAGWTTASLTINNTVLANNGYRYRVQLTSLCPPVTNSDEVILTVNPSPVITTQPANTTICEGNNTTMSVVATGAGLSYVWEASVDNGATWEALDEGGVYANVTSATLNFVGVSASMDGIQYRARVGVCSPNVYSNPAILSVSTAPAIYSSGNVIWERFAGYTGTLAALSNDETTIPTQTRMLQYLDAPLNAADSYKARIRAYIYISIPGDYRFYFASDDQGEFWLSSDETKANLIKRAYVTGWTPYQKWDKYATQQSAIINLAQGFYYFEMLMQEGGGGDNMSLGWKTPLNNTITVVGSSNISQSPSIIYGQPTSSYVCIGDTAHYNVLATGTNLAYQWQVSTDNGANWNNIVAVGANPSYSDWNTATLNVEDPILASEGLRYRCNISGDCPAPIFSNAAILNINQNPPTGNVKWERFNGYFPTYNVANFAVLSGDITTVPSLTQTLTSLDAPVNTGDNYYARVKGYLNITEPGNYQFWLISDDQSQFWLSSNSNPASKVLTCSEAAYTPFANIPTGTQRSGLINLAVGYYYFELLHREGSGGDHLRLKWTTPSNAVISLVPSSNISQTAPIYFIAQPHNDTICTGSSTSFAATAYGFSLSYQWEYSPDDGTTWFDISAAGANPQYSGWNTNTLSITDVPLSHTNYLYRVKVSSNCAPMVTSSSGKVVVNPPPTIDSQPVSLEICQGSNATFSVVATGSNLSYKWQESINGSGLWTDLGNTTIYSGVYTNTLTITNVRAWMNTYKYRCMVSECIPEVVSNEATLTVNTIPKIHTPGVVYWERFNAYHDTLSVFLNNYTLVPNETRYLTSVNGPHNYADYYKSRVTGFIVITEPGNYQFTIASDDQSEFWLSTDDNPKNMVKQAFENSSAGYLAWQTGAERTPVLNLAEGYYYFTMVHTERTGGDNLSLGWITPSNPVVTVVPTENISLTTNPNSGQPQDVYVCLGEDAQFSVSVTGSSSYNYQWQVSTDNGTSWNNIVVAGTDPTYSGFNSDVLTLTNIIQANSTNQYKCVITGPCGLAVTSNAAILGITSAPTKNVVWERFNGYPGPFATLSADVITVPSQKRFLNKLEAPNTVGDNYSARIKGYLYITEPGDYRFWTSSDDGSEFWLSTDEDPANKTRRCYETSWSGVNVWENGLERSAIINLAAGYYYFEMLHKEGTGGDNLSLGWTTPSNAVISVVPGTNISQYPPTVVASNPISTTLCPTENTTFTVVSKGVNLLYQWQISVDTGNTWSDITTGGANPTYVGWTTTSLTVNNVAVANNGYQYRCVVQGACMSSDTSNAAILTVSSTPTVTADPVDATTCQNANTTFSVTASGSALNYQWQISTDGGVSWLNQTNGGIYTNMTTSTMNITGAPFTINNYRYRAVVSGCVPNDTSAAGIVTILPAPTVTVQPTNTTSCEESSATFSVTVTGELPTYQWQESNDGTNWVDVVDGTYYANATTNTLTLSNLLITMNTYRYRCVISGFCSPSTTSNAATLTVNARPTITGQQTDIAGCEGSTINRNVVATGVGLTYIWQVSADTGATWATQPNAVPYSLMTSASMKITGVQYTMNKYQYRSVVGSSVCAITDTSTPWVLTVNTPPNITINPQPVSTCIGETARFSIVNTGDPVTYRWQRSTNGGANWGDLTNGGSAPNNSGATTDTLLLSGITAASNNHLYRCRVASATGCTPPDTSNSALLTVNNPPIITAQPVAEQVICEGDNTSYSVTATGTSIVYQWQQSTDGGTVWGNTSEGGIYSGTQTNTLSITGATSANDSTRYKVVVTGLCTGVATSVPSLLVVNNAPEITNNPHDSTICDGGNAGFSVEANGKALTYQWQLSIDNGTNWANQADDAIYSGMTTESMEITGADETMDGYLYHCVINGACLPAVTSSASVLNINSLTNITGQPASTIICEGSGTSYTVSATGTSLTYQWQLSINGGVGWNNLSNGGVYSNVTSATLNISAVNTAMHNYVYHCVVTGSCLPPVTSDPATLTVQELPNITGQPANATLCAGNNTTFGVTATGTNLTYQWQISTNGGLWWNDQGNVGVYTGMTTATMTITGATVGMNNYRYRCVVSGTCTPFAVSNAGVLTVQAPPAISAHPVNRSLCENLNTTFSVTASGTGLTYQWQRSTDGTNWADEHNGGLFSGMTTATMTITAIPFSMHNNQFRCVVSGTCTPSITSNAGILSVTQAPVITVQPIDMGTCVNELTTFTLTATGSGLTYKWYRSSNGGGTWGLISNGGVFTGATTNSLTISNPLATWNGFLFRCVINGTCNPVATSNNALLTVKEKPQITIQPIISYACENGDASFSLTAKGSDLNYQWLLSTDGGFNFYPIVNDGIYSNVNSNVLNITNVPLSYNNYRYQCEVSGSCIPSVKSNPKFLIVYAKPNITVQPNDTAVCEGTNPRFSVAATGAGLTYLWQLSTNGGVTWANQANDGVYSNMTIQEMRITGATLAMQGYQYRCIVSGTCTPPDTSDAAILTINTPPSINSNPINDTVCPGENTQFSVVSVGTGLTYQWQISTNNGGTWANQADDAVYSDMTTATMSITGAVVTMNNYQYRCVVSGSCNPSVTSSAAILTVYSVPAITVQPVDFTVCQGYNTTLSLTATGSGLTYQWEVSTDNGSTFTPLINDVVYSNVTTNVLTFTAVTGAMAGYQYQCVVSGFCTPTVTSNVAELTLTQPTLISTQPVGTTLCQSAGLNLSVVAAGTNLTYQWRKNGANILGATSDAFTILSVAVTDSGNYDVVVTGDCGSVTSNVARVNVNPSMPVSITIAASDNPICQYENSTFTATPVNSGSNPVYQWKVNGVNVGTGVLTYSYNPIHDDEISIELTSDITCATGNPATSNTVTMTVWRRPVTGNAYKIIDNFNP